MFSTRPEPTARRVDVTYRTVDDGASFASLRGEWDQLVRAMPRPSPFMLHAWLTEWWRHFGDRRRLCVQTARVGGELVAALPLCIDERGPLRTLRFMGAGRSTLGDLLLAGRAPAPIPRAVVERAARSGQHVADLFGLPGGSRLAAAAEPGELCLVPRLEAPVLDLTPGWDAVYEQ